MLQVKLSMLVKISADNILKYFFLFSSENRLLCFMQLSPGDNLHEMLKPFLGKILSVCPLLNLPREW